MVRVIKLREIKQIRQKDRIKNEILGLINSEVLKVYDVKEDDLSER